MDNEHESLHTRFQELLKKDSPSGRTLWTSVRCNLSQFHLTGLYSEACIINEVYIRADKYTAKGNTIDNLLAWSKTVAFNYVRELSRQVQKSQSLDQIQKTVEHLQAESIPISEEDIEEDLQRIRKAFEQLPLEDQELLALSVLQDLPWKQIQEHLASHRGKVRKEPALRKAKERAIKRLRENYHSLEEKERMTSSS